jgi:transposase-like protein
VLLVVLWRLRYQLRLPEFAAMFRARGFACIPEAVRDWAARFASLITPQLRAQRKGQTGRSWHVDAMYLKVAGQGHSL